MDIFEETQKTPARKRLNAGTGYSAVTEENKDAMAVAKPYPFCFPLLLNTLPSPPILYGHFWITSNED